MKLISILLPVYNAEAYLVACLDSILAQRDCNWELLAVEDFSSDKSWEILKVYSTKDQRIKIFKNTEKGIIPALRLAFQHSSGELITRMDADDRMTTDKLASLEKALIPNGLGYLATALVAYFSEQTLGNGYQSYANWLNDLTGKSTNFDEIYKECVIPSPAWMIHRADLLACGAFDSDRYPEDYDLCFRFYEQRLKVIGVTKILHYWRDHSERTSRTSPVYADNRFLDIKLHYFLKLDYQKTKTLVLWGAGKKGKAIAKYLNINNIEFRWLCNQESKWGHQIQNTILENYQNLPQIEHPQVIIAVAAKDAQKEIRSFLETNNIQGADFFFFC